VVGVPRFQPVSKAAYVGVSVGVLAIEIEFLFGTVRALARGTVWAGPTSLIGYAIMAMWTGLVVFVGYQDWTATADYRRARRSR